MANDTGDRGANSGIDGDKSLLAFLKLLDPTDNSTGGGTASAVAGAMAAALVAMVARLSIGKPGMADDTVYDDVNREAQALSMDLFMGGYRDSQAFQAVQASHKLPRETKEQKRVRQEAIQRAIVRAARVPLANAEACKRLLDLCSQLRGRSNPSVASDLECARHLAQAGLSGCLANLEINLPLIKEEKLGTELAERARGLQKSVQATGNHPRV